MLQDLHIEAIGTPGPRLEVARAWVEAQGHAFHEGHNPVRIVRRGDEIVGVSQILNVPIHLSTWAKGSSRNAITGIHLLRASDEAHSLTGASYCFVSEDSPFKDEVMERLGYRATGLQLFVSQIPSE